MVIHFDSNVGDVYKRGRLYQCLDKLKWLDATGELRETWFTYRTTESGNLGIDNGKIISLGNETRQLIIQHNEFTDLFVKEQRFIFDRSAWKLSSIDRLSDGLIYLVLQQDTYNSTTDNLELGVADYYGKVANYKVEILNRDVTAFKVGETLRLNVKVTNRDVPIEAVVTYSSSDESIATIDKNGMITAIAKGSCVVGAEYKNVSDSIQLNVIEDVVNNYSAEITGDDFIKYNMIKTFTAIFRNNGTQQVDKSRFWITGLDGEVTMLATITEQNDTENTCKIKAGNKKGYILLHVENSSGLSEISKKIEIKSLL